MREVPDRVRRQVIRRAADRCEYCGLSQAGQEATFHIDHIIPIAAGGATVVENLALACVSCSLRKGARRTAPDPQTGAEVALYHPRRENWQVHFRWEGVSLEGQTPTGRATIAALDMNRPIILAIRREEKLLGRHPPPDRLQPGSGRHSEIRHCSGLSSRERLPLHRLRRRLIEPIARCAVVRDERFGFDNRASGPLSAS